MRIRVFCWGLALAAGLVLASMLTGAGTPGTATAASSSLGGTTPSGLVITCGLDPQDKGEDKCTVTVGGGTGSVTPTGQVDFAVAAGASGTLSAPTCGLPASSSNPPPQTASCTVDYGPAVAAGTQVPITATYDGDVTYAPSTGTPSAAIVTGAATPVAGWTPASGTEGGYSGTSPLPEFNLQGLSTGGSDSITAMDMTSGVYSGTSEVDGIQFADNGVENGNYEIFELTEGGYTATDTDELYLLPNGDLGEMGEFDAGMYASDLGQVSGRIGASETIVCTPIGGTDSFTCTETVTGSSGTPTGNATFSDANGGSFSPSTACVLSGGSCSVQYTPAGGGDDSGGVDAVYSGDTTYDWTGASIAGGGTNTTTTTTPGLNASGTQVVCNDVMPGQAGDTDQCTATVGGTDSANPSAVPTGSVTFAVDSGDTGGFPSGATCTLSPSQDGGNTAFCSVDYSPPAALGTEPPITATYSGDTNFASSSGSPSLGGGVNTGTDTTPTTTTQTTTTPAPATTTTTTTTPPIAMVTENAAGQYVLGQPALGLPAGTVLDVTACYSGNPTGSGSAQAQRVRRPVLVRPAYNSQHPNPAQNGGTVGDILSYCAVNTATNVGQFAGVVVKYVGTPVVTVGVFAGGIVTAAGTANPVTGVAIASASAPVAGAAGYAVFTAGDSIQSALATAQQDPPDPDYKIVAKPAKVVTPAFNLGKGQAALGKRLDTLVLDIRRVTAYSNVFTTTLNRAGGARDRKATQFEGLQTRAAVGYAKALVTYTSYVATHMASVVAAVDKVPSVGAINYTKLAAQARKDVAHGLTAKMRKELAALGVPASKDASLLRTLRASRTLSNPLTLLAKATTPELFKRAAKAFEYYLYDPDVIAAAKLK